MLYKKKSASLCVIGEGKMFPTFEVLQEAGCAADQPYGDRHLLIFIFTTRNFEEAQPSLRTARKVHVQD